MAVPETHLREIARWCEQRVSERALHQLRIEYSVRGGNVTILELRAP